VDVYIIRADCAGTARSSCRGARRAAIGDESLREPNHNINQQVALLATAEFLLFAAAPYLAALIRFGIDLAELEEVGAAQQIESAIFAVVLLLSATAMGLYSRRLRVANYGLLLRFGLALLSTLVVMALIFYIVPSLFLGRGLMGLACVISFLGFVVTRVAFSRLSDGRIFRRKLLVYGTGRRVTGLSQLRRRTERSRFDIVGFVVVPTDSAVVPENLCVKLDKPLLQFCEERQVDEIVVGIDDRRNGFPTDSLLECKLRGIAVTEAVDFVEREAGKIRLDALNSSWILFGSGFGKSRRIELGTRVLDMLGGTALLLLGLPVMALAAAAILIEDGPFKPVFYRQNRVGRLGRTIQIVKLRSMCVDAETAAGPCWAQKEDPRITRVGRLLRLCRIDELPQLWNVIKGDLSLVGPRPERPEFVSQLERDIPYYRERHIVKPGLTGWAQLCYPYGSSQQDTREKLQYDLYYVKNRSVFFNLMILMQTVEVILFGKGAR
jgi:sugar transferase (PEP-CTERM system associated)